MSPEIREAIFDKPDQEASREGAPRVEYLVGFIEDNEEALRDAFLSEEVPEEKVSLFLYERTALALRQVESKLLQSVGVTISHRLISDTGENANPLIKLGWMRWVPVKSDDEDFPTDRKVTHVLLATKEGRKVVDGLRAAQGYVEIQEQRRIDYERSQF